MPNKYVPVITVDGPGGSGKGTLCKQLAEKLGWNLLDSGALYRLVALAAHHHGVELNNEESLVVLAAHLDVQFIYQQDSSEVKVVLEGEEVTDKIRTETVGKDASTVAAIGAVRHALLERQRAFAEAPGLVADGRDMGTVVFPQADMKIYLDASADARAERRYKQLKEKGLDANLKTISQDIQNRDERDMNRNIAPLKPPEDAVWLDSTKMTIEEVLEEVLDQARHRGLREFLIDLTKKY